MKIEKTKHLCDELDLCYLDYQGYDFFAIVKNRTNKKLKVTLTPYDGGLDTVFDLKPDDWMGFLADERGMYEVELLKNDYFKVETN